LPNRRSLRRRNDSSILPKSVDLMIVEVTDLESASGQNEKTRYEQMFSALHPGADVVAAYWHLALASNADSVRSSDPRAGCVHATAGLAKGSTWKTHPPCVELR
jgi:hypothetical protein